MDPIEVIVKRMVDAGESEEDIAAVIKHHQAITKPSTSAGDFWGGVGESLGSGEAAMASLKGLGGFAKGAVLDLPSSIWEGAKTLVRSQSPNMADRAQLYQELAEAPGQMWETTKKAGSHPSEFGEMMGQVTGQPVVTEGIGRLPVTAGIRSVGRGIESAGKFQEAHTPISKLVPRAVSVPAMEAVESATGRGLAAVGKRAQQVGIPKVIQNSEYGAVPFTPEKPLTSPTGPRKGSVAYPETNPFDPSVTQNNEYGPTDFTPERPLISPTGQGKGGMTYPELNDTPPSLIQNNEYGPPDAMYTQPNAAPSGEMRGGASYPETSETAPELVPNSAAASDAFNPEQPLVSPTGQGRGGMSYPETNQFDPSLMQNADYGPVDFTPDQPLNSPTGPNKGSVAYPELADTPASLVPNSQAAIDQFADSVLAPTGEMKGGMSYPETSTRPPDVVMNNEYGPIDWTPEPFDPPTQPIDPPTQPSLPRPNEPIMSPDEVDKILARPAEEWKPGMTRTTPPSDIPESPRISVKKAPEGYREGVLKTAGKGIPGLTTEQLPNNVKRVVFRGTNGEPLASATIHQGKNGEILIGNIAGAKGAGLSTSSGRAVLSIMEDAITKKGVTGPMGQISPDALKLWNRMKLKYSK